MIPGLILVLSLAALLQFFVSYCRSLIAASSREELSSEVREAAGIGTRSVPGDDFRRLVQLVDLCPEPAEGRNGIRAIRVYFRLLSLLRSGVNHLGPAVGSWVEMERQACAHFAAVALDHRIAYSRDLMAAQLTNRI